jgi:hypothetical protein
LTIKQFLAKHSSLTLHLTSPLPTFLYSLNSKLPIKKEDFRQLTYHH